MRGAGLAPIHMKLALKQDNIAQRDNGGSCRTNTSKPARQKTGRQGDENTQKTLLIEQQLIAAGNFAEAIIEEVQPLLVLDPKLRVQKANKSFCDCFKISSSQTLNRRVYELGNGQWNIPKLRTLLEDVLPRKSFFKEFEMTHTFEKIGTRTMLLNGRQIDHLQKILLFIEDITERRQAQAAIRNTEIRYRRLFEAARDGILILDPETRKITDANPFMTELLGYTHGELNGKELWEIGLLKDEKCSRKAFSALQKDHFIRYENLPLQNKAGQRHEVEFVSNLYDEDGRQVIQCNIRDITERKRAARALLTAKNEIAQHARELEQVVTERTQQLRDTIGELEGFSYSVSHDMRAPLRAMQGFASYLVDEYSGKLDAQGVNYLHQIKRSAARLDRLIQDVLSYTRILHSRLPTERVDLEILVHDIIESIPNDGPVKAEFRVQGPLPAVMGNEALLAQCVSNLLSNGAKFVSAGTAPRVKISAEAIGDDSVRLWFADHGIGIAPEDHTRIFRLFERIHPDAEYEGTGIGLTIVRKAVERMGGDLGVESELGHGSKFWIQLKKG
jgi:PAS domain S-box-containing protein